MTAFLLSHASDTGDAGLVLFVIILLLVAALAGESAGREQ